MIPYLPSLRSGILWRGDVQYFWQSPTGVNAADPQIPALPLLNPSGGLSAISGTNVMTLTNAGQLLGAGALAGTDALTLTNSASITGFGALAGTNALTFTNAGALGSESQIAGTNAITLTNTGSVTGSGALTGTDAITLTNSATISGSGALSGVNALTITNSAVLSGEGAIAGLNAITFTNTGALDTPSGAMQGINAITISNIGELSGLAALDGVNSMFLSNTGTLDLPQQINLGGHFGFDEKRRKRRFDDDREAEEKRKQVLRNALFGLPEEDRNTITIKPEATIENAAQTKVDYERLLKRINSTKIRNQENEKIDVLRDALLGLPPGERETVTMSPDETINRAMRNDVEYRRLLKRINAIQNRIENIRVQDEQDIAEVRQLIRAGLI